MTITKSLLSAMVPAMLALALLAGPALATDVKGHDKGKGGGEECSPGWFKNHVEEWEGTNSDFCNLDASAVEDLLIALNARGPGGNIIRGVAQSFLTACFEVQPCDDD